MTIPCAHDWHPDPTNAQFEECPRCGAVRQVQGMCPTCGGRRWTAEMHDDPLGGKKPKYRAPCGTCGATGLVPLDPPRLL
jgi:ribosomal protein S27AE